MEESTAAARSSQGWRSVSALLDARAAETPDAPAASFPDGESTYAALAAATVLAARRLHAAGVGRGDHVGILLRAGSEPYTSHALGAVRLGAICVPVNARNKVRELDYVVRHSGMRLLLTEEQFRPLVDETGLPEDCRAIYLADDTDFAETLAPEEDVAALEVQVDREDAALLLYTSGTTANPKGCINTHATLLAEGENCSGRLGMHSGDRFWTPLPMFHVGGYQVMMSAFFRGACFSHAGLFEPTQALDQLERERVTIVLPAFELIWMSVLGHPRFPTADLSALRIVVNVGVPERLRAMQETVPQAVQVSCFGMTESAGSICIGSPEDSLESRLTTSGRALPGIEIRVIDPPTGEEAAPGSPGELHFRGATRFKEYYRDPAATAAAIDAEGFFHTGDLVRRDADGYVSFLDRLKDMLKVGGENVSAAEIEDYLLTHPAVEVAAVVGAPDARYGEVPAAYVRLQAGAKVDEDALIGFCLGQISTYKVPRYVRFVDEYPATPTQKIKKFVLRERIRDELAELGITEATRLVSGNAVGRP